MKKIILILILLAVIAGGYLFLKGAFSKPIVNQRQGEEKSSQTQSSSVAGEEKITIKNLTFSPAAFNIKKGAKITWVNEDSAPHTVTAKGEFDSGTLEKGQSFSYVFNKTGVFDYTCLLHPFMKGKIIVED